MKDGDGAKVTIKREQITFSIFGNEQPDSEIKKSIKSLPFPNDVEKKSGCIKDTRGA